MLLQLSDIAETVLKVDHVDAIQKASLTGTQTRKHLLWVYLQHQEKIVLNYGTGEDAVSRRKRDIRAILNNSPMDTPDR